MTFSLRWLLITLAVIGASTQATAMSPRLALLATAQTFGQDYETSPVPATRPECPGCCESSSWLRQMAECVPYVGRLFAPPSGAIRLTLKIEGRNQQTQHTPAVVDAHGWPIGARAFSLAIPLTRTQDHRVAEACCGCGVAVAGRVAPDCDFCPNSCQGCKDACRTAREMPIQAVAPATFFIPGVGMLRMAGHGSPNTLQVCPATPAQSPVAPQGPIWIQRTIAVTPSSSIGGHIPAPPQVHAGMIQPYTTSAVPSAPPALKMQASQVHLTTSTMEVAADRMQHVGDDVLLEGNVRMVLKRGSGEPVRVTAARVVVNLRDNSFRVGQAPTGPAVGANLSHFGVERMVHEYQPSPVNSVQPATYPTMRYFVLPVQATHPSSGHMPAPTTMPAPVQIQLPWQR